MDRGVREATCNFRAKCEIACRIAAVTFIPLELAELSKALLQERGVFDATQEGFGARVRAARAPDRGLYRSVDSRRHADPAQRVSCAEAPSRLTQSIDRRALCAAATYLYSGRAYRPGSKAKSQGGLPLRKRSNP